MLAAAGKCLTEKSESQLCSMDLWWCAVSRSEAGQQKELLVLDSNWQELERIPLDVGPRHFALSSATPALPADLRPGDK